MKGGGTSRAVFALACAVAMPWAWAEPLPDQAVATPEGRTLADQPGSADLHETRALEALYAGVVVNQTLTIVAQDFYQYFVAAWRDKPLSERYAVSIHERPSARWGSLVWVEYANRKIFQSFLPPARARIKALSLDAVEVAYQNMVDADVVSLLFQDPDLGPDELKN